MKRREEAKKNAIELIEKNLDIYNEWSHQSQNHIWIECMPDGSVYQTEEADMQTRHYIDYPDEEVANILDIAICQYCDCDACASFNQSTDPDIDDVEFESRWGYKREDVCGDFAQHLKDYEMFNYDLADAAVKAIDEIPYGYFDDEEE